MKSRLSLGVLLSLFFIALSLAVVSLVLYINFITTNHKNEQITKRDFRLKTSLIKKSIENQDMRKKQFVDTLSIDLAPRSIDNIFENKDKILTLFANFIDTHKGINSIFVSTFNNRVFLVRKISYSKDILIKWVTREIKNGIEVVTFYDEEFSEIKSMALYNNLLYNKQNWFIKAHKVKPKTVKTDVYEFDIVHEKGVTYSKEYKKGYILCMNVLLKDIVGELPLKDDVKNVYIANGKMLEKDNEVSQKIYENYKKDPQNTNIKVSDVSYLFNVVNIGKDYLLFYKSINDSIKRFVDSYGRVFELILFLHVVLFFVVWYILSGLFKPFKELELQVDKLAKGEDLENILQKSDIKEFDKIAYFLFKASKSLDYIKKLSLIDPITLVKSRTALDDRLNIVLEDFIRYGRIFGVMAIDVECDEEAKNEFLKEFAGLIKENIRKGDIIGRWSENEFLIISQEIKLENLENLAYKLKALIDRHHFRMVADKNVNFAVAVYYKNDSVKRIISRLFTALHIAKEGGKNRVEIG